MILLFVYLAGVIFLLYCLWKDTHGYPLEAADWFVYLLFASFWPMFAVVFVFLFFALCVSEWFKK